uniref:Uncharacterized protein n=1 Tax=Arundo donax TaxID=35708 RepID=A0A0A9FLK5_ARUDO
MSCLNSRTSTKFRGRTCSSRRLTLAVMCFSIGNKTLRSSNYQIAQIQKQLSQTCNTCLKLPTFVRWMKLPISVRWMKLPNCVRIISVHILGKH